LGATVAGELSADEEKKIMEKIVIYITFLKNFLSLNNG
jgi:hypothetical protein